MEEDSMITTQSNKADVKKIHEIISLNLKVPDYQRPYKWESRHIHQLANDLWVHFQQEKIYRIGTVVIHDDDQNNYIVDGQQRLVSLSLLLYVLDEPSLKNPLLTEKFPHSISQYNINQNYLYLQSWLKENINKDHYQKFADYILKKCEMVCVTLTDLDEAFQFFDSQNARGKPLEAYDLLKAFHLREMQDKPETVVHQSVSDWEKSALASSNSPNLDKIINQILFRLRRWQYGLESEALTSQYLETFKGISEQESKNYPYLRSTHSARALHQFAKANPLLLQPHFQTQGFQATQPLINGEWFFDYIQYYRHLYQELFNPKTGKLTQITMLNNVPLDKNLIEFLDSYQHSSRTGDRYLRTLFENVVFAYYDKFSDNHLESFINKAFWWVYRIRLQYARIGYPTMENEATARNSLFNIIEQAGTPAQVLQFRRQIPDINFDNVDNTIKKIFELGEK